MIDFHVPIPYGVMENLECTPPTGQNVLTLTFQYDRVRQLILFFIILNDFRLLKVFIAPSRLIVKRQELISSR